MREDRNTRWAALLPGVFIMMTAVAGITAPAASARAADFNGLPNAWCESVSPLSGLYEPHKFPCRPGDNIRVGVNIVGTGETEVYISLDDQYGSVRYLRRPRFVSLSSFRGGPRYVYREFLFSQVYPSAPQPGQGTTQYIGVWVSLSSPMNHDFDADDVIYVPFEFPLTVAIDSSGPVPSSVPSGSTRFLAARYLFTASTAGDVPIRGIWVQAVTHTGQCYFSNVSLWVNAVQIGAVVATPDQYCTSYFPDVNQLLTAASTVSIGVYADIAVSAALGDTFSFNLVGVNVNPSQAAGIPVVGPTLTVSQDCEHSGVCPTPVPECPVGCTCSDKGGASCPAPSPPPPVCEGGSICFD